MINPCLGKHRKRNRSKALKQQDVPLDGVEDVAVEMRVMPHGRVSAALARVPVGPKLVVERLALTALHPVLGKRRRVCMCVRMCDG